MSSQLIINVAFVIISLLQHYSAANSKKSCPNKSEYFSTPLEAFKYSSREEILYIACISLTPNEPDYLAVIDVDPKSSKYLEVRRLKIRRQRAKDHLLNGQYKPFLLIANYSSCTAGYPSPAHARCR